MPDPSGKKLDVPLPLRVTSDMHAETKHAGKRLRMEYQDAHRFAAAIGLRLLREIDYAVDEAIVEAAIRVAIKKKSAKHHP